MGSPKRSVDTTRQSGSQSSSSSGSSMNTNTSGMTGLASGYLDDYLAKAASLAQGNYVAPQSALQGLAFGSAPGLFQRGMTGLNTLEGMASGGTQNEALQKSIQDQLGLAGGSYLNTLMGKSGGLTNSGAQEDWQRRAGQIAGDRLSDEYRFNIGTQMNAANAMPGYISGMLSPLANLGGIQRGIETEQRRAPLFSNEVLGNALQMGGARYGTQNRAENEFSGQESGLTSSMAQRPGATKPSMLGSLLGMAGTLGGAFLGGPAGASIGSALGSGISGLFSGGQAAPSYMPGMAIPGSNRNFFGMGGT